VLAVKLFLRLPMMYFLMRHLAQLLALFQLVTQALSQLLAQASLEPLG
jgi:hypothetical protein